MWEELFWTEEAAALWKFRNENTRWLCFRFSSKYEIDQNDYNWPRSVVFIVDFEHIAAYKFSVKGDWIRTWVCLLERILGDHKIFATIFLALNMSKWDVKLKLSQVRRVFKKDYVSSYNLSMLSYKVGLIYYEAYIISA